MRHEQPAGEGPDRRAARIQPLARSAGGAGDSSVDRHGVRVQRVLAAAQPRDRHHRRPSPADWKISTLGWMYTLFFVMLGSSAALFGSWVEREGPRKAGVVAACCWGGGFFVSAARHLPASDLAALARLGRHRRMRSRPRLHLAGVDADQMVSRSTRHGHRARDHGVRRRRDDRHAARRPADAPLLDAHVGRRVADLRRAWRASTSRR